ncbi:Uncharacterized protein PECH_002248 [Penicillium ucsense]|uniref:Sec20 C-terminal domain-containing protein n=1 Tax=Penicillium ucsense TaxID=2839758 RepID=A0A8J8W5W1_9EURO|nr:Uncharacterized protein PECM_004174 [Penicillium ucsense]KAF7731122.1 Uncharacterized protein PECH_002248 [Penicillium ucsense]
MSAAALQVRLKELSAALGQIQPLVDRLRNFTASVGQGDEARLELGAEIHSQLKDAEGDLELLRGDIEALDAGYDGRRKSASAGGDKEAERARVVAMCGRLAEEMKRTRVEFRTAQLQAKRNAELAKRKERELLLMRSHTGSEKITPSQKLTQDDLVLNASNDVTAALRRTHTLMQAELSRSQFAQETLEQSTAAISSLSESYSSLDTLLANSRSLANSLLRSQKSDTWYLETAFYILVGTISWLIFRRILYGPMWWLVWLPVKLSMRFMLMVLGALGMSKGTTELVPDSMPTDVTATMHQAATAMTGGPVLVGDEVMENDEADEAGQDRIIDQIGRMVENGKWDGADINEDSIEELEGDVDIIPNPKKRMYEGEIVRDEL